MCLHLRMLNGSMKEPYNFLYSHAQMFANPLGNQTFILFFFLKIRYKILFVFIYCSEEAA